MIRVFMTGQHSHRTPLSYPALAPLWRSTISLVERPEQADLYLFSHVPDIEAAPRAVVEDWRHRQCPVVLLSEEPFWDTIWGKRPMAPLIYVETDYGALPVVQINHQTSTLYDFDTIPYYLLTNPRFARAYQSLFQRNAALSAQDWRAAFQHRQADLVFMFERRPEPWHDVSWPEGDVTGLCAWRTRLAMSCRGPRVEHLGHSWQGGPRRQALPDWHKDKLSRLDGRTVLLSALENTHQPHYLTEKIFDAFACGAIPFYWASPAHRIHGIGLPPESWINLHGLTPEKAAEEIMAYRPDAEVFEAYAEAQTTLVQLFCDAHTWEAERARLARALPAALQAVLNSAQPIKGQAVTS